MGNGLAFTQSGRSFEIVEEALELDEASDGQAWPRARPFPLGPTSAFGYHRPFAEPRMGAGDPMTPTRTRP